MLARQAASADSSDAHIVIADLRAELAEKVANQVRDLGVLSTAIGCDISDEEQVRGLARQVEQSLGRVNLLFNVAGVTVIKALHETSAADVEWLFSVNVFGLCHMVRHFMPLLQSAAQNNETARVVNVSSGFGVAVPSMGPVQPSAYSGTKHAVVGLSDAMRKELAPEGIGVSVVCPGLVSTETWNSMSFRQERFGGPVQGSDESRKRVETWGQDPDETARLILAGMARGDFFILPLNDSGRASMRTEVNDRHAQILAALDDSA